MSATGGLPARARVVVVGGGVVGASIAYHLCKLGWTDVLLLERDRLTSGTTWHAAGLITSAGFTDESGLFMARYTRDLYARLEAETGLSTGFRPVGHVSLACTPNRLEALRREAAFAHGHGVPDVELSRAEVAAMWPAMLRTDDVLAGFYVPDEGRADPVGVTMSLAKGARMQGATLVEQVRVTGVTSVRGRVTGVQTDRGPVEAEYVVNAAGMWAREFGRLAGVDVPLQAAEHYYLITEAIPGLDRDLPVIEDPDRYGYYRPEGDGLLVGLFEPVAAPWQLDRVPADFSFGELAPDWERLGPYVERAMDRIPSLADVGIRKFFCGPESFTADVHPLLGPAPELDNYFVAAGMNSLGILLAGGVGTVLAHWIVDGEPPIDTAGYGVDRVSAHESTRLFRAQRTVEQLGVLFGDAVLPTWQPRTARDVRRTVLHDRFVAAGAHFNVSAGWEYPEWFGGPDHGIETVPGFGRQPSFPVVAEEHLAVRRAVGILDMTLMAKFMVQGPDSAAVLSRLSANHVAREVGRIVYTQWLSPKGGILADLTVTRLADGEFLVIASDVIQRRVAAMIRRERRAGEHVYVTDVTSATTLLSVQGPRSRELLSRLTDCDLSNDAFPYLTARTIELGHARMLAGRVTYVGELGYELHVPTEYAAGVYDLLLAEGADLGVRPIGFAALAGLRLEKGYRDIGVDIDSTDNPVESGLGFAVAWDKPGGFTGRDAVVAIRDAAPRRRLLVSVLGDDATVDLHGNEPVLCRGQWAGYVRAGAYGHAVGAPVGLAMVESGSGVTPEWLAGGDFEIATPHGRQRCRLQAAPPYDPTRSRVLAR